MNLWDYEKENNRKTLKPKCVLLEGKKKKPEQPNMSFPNQENIK